jgi:hypothetical protein
MSGVSNPFLALPTNRAAKPGVHRSEYGPRSELDQVTSELATARIKYASLGARIAGLEAQHLALSKALTRTQPGAATTASFPRHRTDAIVAVLEMTGTEMSIQDVIAALGDVGRPGESYDNVSADLAYLTERGRAKRTRRGVYAATSA